ncbi:MAG TPA: hypothetical protein VKD69_18810 [Vicinamibacterales bacterium]|nr:hypothetical protein [Vicinamibacterales bacterium]
MRPVVTLAVPLVIAMYHPFCTPEIRATMPPWNAPLADLWQRPQDLPHQDLFNGPFGARLAPDPQATYTFIARKQNGTNPGVTVHDPDGREWHVKQPPHNDQGAEGPVEVVLSRVLSALGYHQPPVYFLPSLTIDDGKGRTHVEPGGRFRLTDNDLKHVGEWSWQQNPFVGMRPYQGLLVILIMFDSSDLKNANNALYEISKDGVVVQHWYVVRDLGTALGETGRLAPQRSDPDIFARERFIVGVENGFVRFNYRGWHQELLKAITPDDVVWASELLAQLDDHQWSDAFRAGGYAAPVADRFIGRLHEKIAEGLRLRDGAVAGPAPPLPARPTMIGRR